MALPDDEMRDGRFHRRAFLARFPGGAEVLVTEHWDEDGTVDRYAALRPTSHSGFTDPADLVRVVWTSSATAP